MDVGQLIFLPNKDLGLKSVRNVKKKKHKQINGPSFAIKNRQK